MCLVMMTVVVMMIMVVVMVEKVVVVMIMIIDYAEIKTKGIHLIHAAAASFMMRVAAPAPTV